MQQFILADPMEFQADLQKKLDKMKNDIIVELSQTLIGKNDDPEYLTRDEVSKKYRISLVTLHSLTVKMKIPSIKVGKRRLYDLKAIDQYFKSK